MHDDKRSGLERSASTPGVAVIIPFYNGSVFIERCLDSVFAQTIPASEVIIVNDGSSIEEQRRLKELAAAFRVRIIDQDNGGQGAARNTGVAASSSEFICFLDQDDMFLPNHIEVLLKAMPFGDLRFGFVYGDLYEADQDGNVVHTTVVKRYSNEYPKRTIFDMLRGDMFVLPSASLISRVAFEAAGGFDAQFIGYEDDDLFLRIFLMGYSNYFIDRAVTVWCIHTESTSHGMLMKRSRFRYFRKLVKMFPDQPDMRRYFVRDCLAPRFGQLFIEQAIDAAARRSDERAELFSNLKAYARIVVSNPHVRLRHKVKLRCAILAIQSGLPFLSKLIAQIPADPGSTARAA